MITKQLYEYLQPWIYSAWRCLVYNADQRFEVHLTGYRQAYGCSVQIMCIARGVGLLCRALARIVGLQGRGVGLQCIFPGRARGGDLQ